MKDTWRTLHRRKAYTYPLFFVSEDTVRRSDGRKVRYSYMSLRPTVGVVALTRKYRLPLIKEYRYPLRKWTLGIPRGLSHRRETALQAAKREAREEAGVAKGFWRSLGRLHPSSGMSDEVVHLFLVDKAELVPVRPKHDERQTVVWTSFQQALRWAMKGVITDAPTVAALFRAQEYVRRHRRRRSSR